MVLLDQKSFCHWRDRQARQSFKIVILSSTSLSCSSAVPGSWRQWLLNIARKISTTIPTSFSTLGTSSYLLSIVQLYPSSSLPPLLNCLALGPPLKTWNSESVSLPNPHTGWLGDLKVGHLILLSPALTSGCHLQDWWRSETIPGHFLRHNTLYSHRLPPVSRAGTGVTWPVYVRT